MTARALAALVVLPSVLVGHAGVLKGGRVAIGLLGEGCDAEGCRPSPILFRVAGSPIR